MEETNVQDAPAAVIDSPVEVIAVAPQPVEPVALRERIETVDILRGFAFFGVLLINYVFFYQPETLMMTGFRWSGIYNQIVEKFDQFFFMGKSYTIFSFLFGLGFSIQLIRAEARGVNLVPTYRRRLFALLLFGIIHGTLIWFGDILTTYALCGFVLILFRNRKQKTILIWVLILAGTQLLLPITRYTVTEIMRRDPKKASEMDEKWLEQKKEFQEASDHELQVYSKGTYRQITEVRTKDYIVSQVFSIVFGGQFLFLFLLGLYAGRRGVFHNVAENEGLLRTVRKWGLIVGLIGNAVVVYTAQYSNPAVPTLLFTVGAVFYVFSIPAMSAFYVSSLTLLIHHSDTWRRRFAPLGFVGRMALTNYLLHSIIGTLIFYSYGLGLYMQFGPAITTLICILLYSLLAMLSKFWLTRFRYGPAEWFWRKLTYGHV